MKMLSILFTLSLFVSANRLAAYLKRSHALPSRSTNTQSVFQNTQRDQ